MLANQYKLKFVSIDQSKPLILLLIVRMNGNYHCEKFEIVKKIIVWLNYVGKIILNLNY